MARDGLYDGLLGSRMFYSYLGLLEQGTVPPGATGNTVIPAGPTPAADLSSGDVIVVRAFSDFGVDNTSGQFSCEIRLGEIRRGGESTPFRGGLLVGNWFDAVSDANYSTETQSYLSYYGPLAVRFNNLRIAD